jgi:hypothetical protein
MTDCLMRNMQRFVEFDLAGILRWDRVRLVVPVDGGGAAVEMSFTLDGRRFDIREESSDLKPPLGEISMNNKVCGPIDAATWAKLAIEIKSWQAVSISGPGTMRELAHGY